VGVEVQKERAGRGLEGDQEQEGRHHKDRGEEDQEDQEDGELPLREQGAEAGHAGRAMVVQRVQGAGAN
jgi:hypothetical protein